MKQIENEIEKKRILITTLNAKSPADWREYFSRDWSERIELRKLFHWNSIKTVPAIFNALQTFSIAEKQKINFQRKLSSLINFCSAALIFTECFQWMKSLHNRIFLHFGIRSFDWIFLDVFFAYVMENECSFFCFLEVEFYESWKKFLLDTRT